MGFPAKPPVCLCAHTGTESPHRLTFLDDHGHAQHMIPSLTHSCVHILHACPHRLWKNMHWGTHSDTWRNPARLSRKCQAQDPAMGQVPATSLPTLLLSHPGAHDSRTRTLQNPARGVWQRDLGHIESLPKRVSVGGPASKPSSGPSNPPIGQWPRSPSPLHKCPVLPYPPIEGQLQ